MLIITEEDTRKLHELSKKEDPTRLTTAASHRPYQKPVTDLICWNRYYGWYSGNITGLATWADSMHMKYPERCIGLSEYGAGGCIIQQQQNPQKPNAWNGRFFPEQYQSQFHEELSSSLTTVYNLNAKS